MSFPHTFSFRNIPTVGFSRGAAISYLLDEGFEGGTEPFGWSHSSGAPNYGYTTSPIKGSFSMKLVNGDEADAPDTATQSSMSYRFAFRIDSAIPATNSLRFGAFNISNFNDIAQVKLLPSGALGLYSGNSVAHVGDTTDLVSPDTDYVVWVDVIKGTGANGILSMGFATKASGVKPVSGNKFLSTSTSDSTDDCGGMFFQNQSVAASSLIVDDVKVAATAGTIGNYP